MKKNTAHPLPVVVVIGAGPVGLSAAAHLLARKIPCLVLERSKQVGSSILNWGHVKMFTPWSYLVDPASTQWLEPQGWNPPPHQEVPTGREFVENYLEPLSRLDAMAEVIRLEHSVTAISRVGHDRMKDGKRDQAPFLIVADTPTGTVRLEAQSVIDASGTWLNPNPLGAAGIAADGERALSAQITYGMPNVFGTERDRFAQKRVLVVGSGHSATGSVLALIRLAEEHPLTQVVWGVRRDQTAKLWGAGADDLVAERGALGMRAKHAFEQGSVKMLTGTSIAALKPKHGAIIVVDTEGEERAEVDEIIVSTGSRPDFSFLRELRLNLDPATEAAKDLGPLVDPNHDSLGGIPRHGAKELAHDHEPGFFIVGIKSYGRAPRFLTLIGYEQVRSVVAKIAGDDSAAANYEFALP